MIKPLRTTFYLYLYRINSKEEVPIFCKLTWSTDRKQFSTDIYIPAERWSVEYQMVIGADDEAMLINKKLQGTTLNLCV